MLRINPGVRGLTLTPEYCSSARALTRADDHFGGRESILWSGDRR